MTLICAFKTVINDVIGRFADTEFATRQLRILADLEARLPAA